MSLKRDLILLLKPYYFVNIILSLSYLAAKKLPIFCNVIFPSSAPQCELDTVSQVIFKAIRILSLLFITKLKKNTVPFSCSESLINIFISFQRESEILFFLLIVVMIRTKKAGSVTMINYLTSSFMYNKVANLILWFYADVRLGIGYAILFVCKQVNLQLCVYG